VIYPREGGSREECTLMALGSVRDVANLYSVLEPQPTSQIVRKVRNCQDEFSCRVPGKSPPSQAEPFVRYRVLNTIAEEVLR
jgi:hypothetical protein